MQEEQRDAVSVPPEPTPLIGPEEIRKEALFRAYASLHAITHGHDLAYRREGRSCNCKACEARRAVERALETYK